MLVQPTRVIASTYRTVPLSKGHKEGIEQLEKTLSFIAPGIHKSDVERLAKIVVDGLMSKNLSEQLGREFPNLLINQQRLEDQLEHQFGETNEGIDLKPGVTLEIHF